MSNYSDNYYSAKENYLKELKKEYNEWANRFHNRFNSWVIRLFGDDHVYLNIWSKGWDRFMDAKCIRIDLNEGHDLIYICEEENPCYCFGENQRSKRDNECDWYKCNTAYSADPIGNYETLLELLKDKLKEYGAIPPRKN